MKRPRITSIAKITPAMVALLVAAMPPAAPQATESMTRRSGRRNHWASAEPNAEPICTMGPSRPAEPPLPMVRAAARILKTDTRARIRPPSCATASMTSGTPWPLVSGAK